MNHLNGNATANMRRFANICVFALGWAHSCCGLFVRQHECTMQDKSSSKEDNILISGIPTLQC